MAAKIVLKLEQRSAKQIEVMFGLKKERRNLVKSILEKIMQIMDISGQMNRKRTLA